MPTHYLPSPKQILTQNGHSRSLKVIAKEFLTQNGHSRSLKVISFDVAEEPLWDYIAKYNDCGLRCIGSEDIAGKISENHHF